MVDHSLHPVLGYLRSVVGADAPDAAPDAALVERFVVGHDESAFAALVERHGGLVYGVCKQVLRDAHDAEDAFQATFLVLARKAATLGRRQALASWLYRVAVRIALRVQRRDGQRRERPLTAEPPAPVPEENAEASALLAEEIDRLSEKYRAPVVLCYLRGRSYDEAARELGYSPGTVNRRLARARDLLRARLEKRGVAPSAWMPGPVPLTKAPRELMAAASKAGRLFALGAATDVPPRVVAWTEGALRAMWITKLKTFAAGAAAILLLSVGAAAALYPPRSAPDPTPTPRPVPDPTPVAKPAAEPTPADVKAAVAGNTAFACDLYAQVRTQPGNLIFSPYSVSSALAMTYAGARGETADEIAKALHFTLGQDKLHPAMGKLIAELERGGQGRPYVLYTANAAWGQKDFPFRDEFLKVQKDHYGADNTPVDYIGDREMALKTINGWVEKKTKEKIKDLLKPDHLTVDTRLVLTNAVYFQGNWDKQFPKKQTREDDFHLAGGGKVRVPLMSQRGNFRRHDTETFQALELPYKGNAASMVVLLPTKADGLPALEKELSAAWLTKVLAALDRPRDTYVYLPRFKSTSEFDLKPTLQAMGMKLAFVPRQADLTGITASDRLHVSAAVHKGFVEVNEEGTEAAAATAVIIETELEPPLFRADRPFLYLIRDHATGSVLFLGRVTDPTK